MHRARDRLLPLFLVALVACKEPVEDRVPTSAPAAPAPRGPRGQPPPQAVGYVFAQPPPIRNPVGANFEDQIELVGYDVPKTRFRPGEAVPLTLFWKARVDPPDNWQVFVHLDPAGIDDPSYRGYGDHYPVFGMYPTTQWKAGQIVRDEITVTLKGNVRTATADLWVGLYDGPRRAILRGNHPQDGRNRLKLAVFEVEGAGPVAVKTYTVHRAEGKIALDGRLDEPSWQKVPSTGRFTRTVGGGPARHDTWAKALWDDERLYFAFYCSDPDIRSPYTRRDDPLWQADAVEVFLDPDGDGKNYYELQVSPANVIFDAFFPRRGPPGNRGGDHGFTADIVSAVRVDGTLNQPGDRDRSWVVEWSVAFKDLKHAPRIPPRIGDAWRANFIRVERTGGAVEDSAWSPPGADYHNLEAMGRLVFAGPPGHPAKGAQRMRLLVDPKKLPRVAPPGRTPDPPK